MFRRDRWWHRELDRVRREHAAERAQLVATICRLAGNPEPDTAVRPTAPPAAPAEPAEILEEA